MSVRILFIGDIHLGLQATRIPDMLESDGLTVHELGPAAAWRRTVDWACRSEVDAVALAGDVCDSANARHEAWFELKRGIEQLAKADISVYAVAGNHDTETLPRLIADLDADTTRVHLLGPGGTWTTETVTGRDGGAVDLVGWSFPTSRFEDSPLSADFSPRRGDRPLLGLLHCNLDGDRNYAPVRSSELLNTQVDQWLLGHIHKPSLAEDSNRPGYLGSLTGLDPSETGRRGPWLLEVGSDGAIRQRQIPLAPLRWERVTLDLDMQDFDRTDFDSQVRSALLDVANRLGADLDETLALGCRLKLTGSCGNLPALNRALADVSSERILVPHGDLLIFLDRTILNDLRPKLDLDGLARGTDPPALLARQLLALEAFDDEGRALVAEARPEMEQTCMNAHYAGLPPQSFVDEEVRRILVLAGRQALTGMLAQKGGLT